MLFFLPSSFEVRICIHSDIMTSCSYIVHKKVRVNADILHQKIHILHQQLLIAHLQHGGQFQERGLKTNILRWPQGHCFSFV